MSSQANDVAPTIADLRALTFGFDELPLEHFRGLTAEEIEAHGGIGPKYRARIQTALAELDELLRAAGEPVPEPPHPTPAAGPDPYLEPAAPGTNGPLIFLMIVLFIAILGGIAWLATGGGRQELQERLTAAEAVMASQQSSLGAIGASSLAEAQTDALLLHRKIRARDYGAALELLDSLDHGLQLLQATGGAGPEPLAAAAAALTAARTAVELEKPTTHQQVEAACEALGEAIKALSGEEVKH